MSLFGKSTNKTEMAKLKRKVARQSMTRGQKAKLALEKAKAKGGELVDRSGRIKVKSAFAKIPEFKSRLAKGLCICGAEPPARGHLCEVCKEEVRDLQTPHTKGNKNVPAGQNTNGIVYCDMGHRVWPDHAGNYPVCTHHDHYLKK